MLPADLIAYVADWVASAYCSAAALFRYLTVGNCSHLESTLLQQLQCGFSVLRY